MFKPAISPPFKRIGPLLLILTAIFVLVWKLPPLAVLQGAAVMALWAHIAAEIFSIGVAGLIFAVTWNAYTAERPAPLIVLACGLLAVGLLDFGHTLSFNGMPDFVTPSGREKGLNFWLAARLLFAVTMVAITFLPWEPLRHPQRRYWLLAGNLSLAGLLFWLILYHPQIWPHTFIEGQGLTPFKIQVEYGIIGLLLIPAVLFMFEAWRDHKSLQADYLAGAAVVTILSELSFTLYTEVTDIFNLLGHLYKIVAFALIYRAVFVVSIREPFLHLRQANAEANEAKTHYATLAELAPVGIFRTDAAGNCLYVNDRWSDIAGLSPAEAAGDGWAQALHPEDRERIAVAWERAARGGQKFRTEYRFQRPDGKITWVLGQAKAELNSNGLPVGHVGTITDITERKEAETQLTQSEERLQLILDGLDALVYVADMETYELLFMNKYGRDIFGDSTKKKCWQVLQAGQDGPCPFCPKDKLLSPGGNVPIGVYAWEIQNTVDGQWYDCRDQVIHWHDGRLVRMEIATNVTLRKQAEEDIRKAKEEWERTFAALGDIATIQDTNHRILRANRKAYEVLGLAPEKLAGRLCYEVFHGGTTPCDGCPVVLTAKDVTTHTAEIVHEKLGRTFLVSASPVCGPDDELVSVVYIARDVTELKALERQLRQAQKMEAIGTLAGGIAHDFNNILTPVLGYAEIINDRLEAGSPLAEPAQEVLKAGRRARDLVKQILTFSRQTEQERTPLRIQLVVKEALKLLRSSLPTTIEIKQEIATEAMVLADPTMIHQVVMNLCTNAYHAMRETGGILAISLSEVEIGADDYITQLHLKPGTYLRLEVSDTGCGMPHHLLERIFEPYFTTKDKGEGTGLGLSMVHGIVTALGGHITVYSEPDKGTTFHVYLPKSPEKTREEAPQMAAPLPKGHEHILVVEDEKVIAELLQKTLEALGYRVTTCIDPRQALERVEEQPAAFDLVITDMTMPHLTGAELAQQLLAVRPGLPVVLCTGFSEIINEEKAQALGIRRLLMKPILRDELAKVLRQILDQPGG